MSERVGGLTLLQVRFDEDGDVDAAAERAVRRRLEAEDATDLVLFSHGWNSSPAVASRLFRAFYARLARLVAAHAPDRRVVLLGVVWPAQRWSDEPVPDFEAAAGPGSSVGHAGLAGALGPASTPTYPAPPPPDPEARAAVRDVFAADPPAAEELLDLLRRRPDDPGEVVRARELLARLARQAGPADDGEADGAPSAIADTGVGTEMFDELALALERLGVVVDDGVTAGPGGPVGLGRAWSGVQEAARQLTYWRMKQRAGVVGEAGVGPFLARLLAARPGLGVHLVGHSFGARLVGYALRGLPATVHGRPPVRGVTLLQGAFSHFAFADRLPHDRSRSGALAGQERKVAGSVVACYSRHDAAVGTFYPLASLLRRDDAAGLDDETYRWGGMGHDGHQRGVPEVPLTFPDRYHLGGARLVNVDASSVVRRGRPPSGAHSDIVHDELAWVVLNAGGLLGPAEGQDPATSTAAPVTVPAARSSSARSAVDIG